MTRFFKTYPYYKITSHFGNRTVNGKKNFHSGVDLVANNGKNNLSDYILCFADGEVIGTGYNSTAGYYVKIKHTKVYRTSYCHLKKGSIPSKIKAGYKIKKGEVIGYMGSTGNSTGAHLHLGIFENDVAIDPELWFDKEFPADEEYIPTVKEWQKAAIADGYKFPKYGADGKWGAECKEVAKKAICKKLVIGFKNKNLTKLIQKAVDIKADGKFGSDTQKAVKAFQKAKGLNADGIVGQATWAAILNKAL